MVAKTKRWEPVKNTPSLIRDVISGRYYARFWRDRKAVWMSLETEKLSVARARHDKKRAEHVKTVARAKAVGQGTATMAQTAEAYLVDVENRVGIKPTTVHYYRQVVATILETWPELKIKQPKDITKSACHKWAKDYASRYTATRYNNAVDVLRRIFQSAIDQGAIYSNPADDLDKRSPSKKMLELPSKEKFEQLVIDIAKQGSWCSLQCSDLVKFLAYSGCRIDEARNIKWKDVTKNGVWIHGGKDGTKNSESRLVPINTKLGELLADLRANPRFYRGDRGHHVLAVTECSFALKNACQRLGIKHMTHHDLRHLFATRCIELGVDIPTVSRWLGHRDGGALAMRTYGHLRDEHSQAVAAKLEF